MGWEASETSDAQLPAGRARTAKQQACVRIPAALHIFYAYTDAALRRSTFGAPGQPCVKHSPPLVSCSDTECNSAVLRCLCASSAGNTSETTFALHPRRPPQLPSSLECWPLIGRHGTDFRARRSHHPSPPLLERTRCLCCLSATIDVTERDTLLPPTPPPPSRVLSLECVPSASGQATTSAQTSQSITYNEALLRC